MKKLFSRFLPTALLILGIMTGCVITPSENSTDELPVSSEPIVERKLKLSLASKVTTDKDSIVLQDNEVSDVKEKNKLRKMSLEEGTSKDSLDISAVEIPHTVIESSENSFDLAITGLASGEFSIVIKENLTDTDVTSEFSWIYRPNQYIDEMYPCKIVNETASYCKSIAKENYFIRKIQGETEVLIFRLFSETYDFKSSDLTLTVSQSITETPSSLRSTVMAEESQNETNSSDEENQNGTVSSDLILTSFDFEIEYDNSLGYTDLNNIGFSITSDLFEVKYTNNDDPDTFYDEGTVLEMSLTDVNVPYEAISIVYRREGTDDEFTIINNYLVVFPHLGGIKSDEIQNPALGIGHKESGFFSQGIRFFDSETFYAPNGSTMKVHKNTWTGIDRADGKLIIDGYDDLPLPVINNSPELILFSYYAIAHNVEIDYMTHGLYDLRVREVIELNLSFKLEISGVIFDLGTLYEIVNPNDPGATSYQTNGNGGFTMNHLQQPFK